MVSRRVWLSFLILCLGAGCYSSRSGEILTQANWSNRRQYLKRVAVLQPQFSDKGMISEEARPEIWRAAKEAVEKIDGVVVVDSDTLEDDLGWNSDAPISDCAIVSAARKRGLDAVCVTTLHEYVARFMLGVFWASTQSIIHYDVRLLDVSSGALLVQSHRRVFRCDAPVTTLHKQLSSDLRDDLILVLTDKPATTHPANSLAMKTNQPGRGYQK